MKKIIICFILGSITLTSCNENYQAKRNNNRGDTIVYEDNSIKVARIKIEGHDYYKIYSIPDRTITIEHLATCKKCYDIFD